VDKCPSDLLIERLLENTLPEEDVCSVRKHIAACSTCSAVFASGLEVSDAEVENLCSPVSFEERERAAKALHDLCSEEVCETSVKESIWERPRRRPSLRDRLHDVFAPVGTGLGLAGAGLSVGGFSGAARSFVHLNERNRSFAGSNEMLGEQALDNEPITEMKMDTNTAQTAWGFSPIDEKSPLVYQGYADTCAIRSQQLILNDFGIDVTQEELIDLSTNKGWYVEGGGTSISDTGNLLDLYGVETNRIDNANIFSLTSELAQGHRVIIGVDPGELWNPGWKEEILDLFGDAPDHALVVAGLDTTDPDNMTVQLMDPGTGDIAKAYPMDQFMDAWSDSNYVMVSTAEAPPPFAPGMDNFDYASLHTPFVGEMPYAEFERFSSLNDFKLGSYSDFDGDLVPDMFDLDADGSGVVDLFEAVEVAGWSIAVEAYPHVIEAIPHIVDATQELASEVVDAVAPAVQTAWDLYAGNLIRCVKGEITVPQMMENVFGSTPPNLGAISLPETVELEIESLFADHDVSFDLSGGELRLADYYSGMSDMFESLGDDASASWYQDQGVDAVEDLGELI